MTPRKVVIFLVLAAAVTGGAVYQFVLARPRSNGSEIRVSGNIEITDAEVAFKIPGLVVERLVDEGQAIRKGQTVAKLDTMDLEADLAARQAELEAARAALAELEAGSRPEEIQSAKAAAEKAAAYFEELKNGSRPQEIQSAQASYDAAASDKTRLEKELALARALREERTISQDLYDQQEAAYRVAAARLRDAAEKFSLVKEGARKEQIVQAEKAFHQAKAQYELVVQGPREEVKQQARAKVKQAEAAVRLAKTKLEYATVNSPLSGVVLTKNVEPGEYVSAGTPVVSVGDLNDMWLRAYIEGTDLGKVKFGQPAKVTTDSYPGKVYQGHISFIAAEAEFTPKSVQTEKERTKLVYRIKIQIDNPNQELKRGMPADAVILLDSPWTSSTTSSAPSD